MNVILQIILLPMKPIMTIYYIVSMVTISINFRARVQFSSKFSQPGRKKKGVVVKSNLFFMFMSGQIH